MYGVTGAAFPSFITDTIKKTAREQNIGGTDAMGRRVYGPADNPYALLKGILPKAAIELLKKRDADVVGIGERQDGMPKYAELAARIPQRERSTVIAAKAGTLGAPLPTTTPPTAAPTVSTPTIRRPEPEPTTPGLPLIPTSPSPTPTPSDPRVARSGGALIDTTTRTHETDDPYGIYRRFQI